MTEQRQPQRSEQRTPPKAPIRLTRPDEDSLQETVIPAIKKSLIPDGMDYNWKRMTYLGKEDKQHSIRMSRYHWTTVPAERHKDAIATDDPSGKLITNGGLVLMERPSYLSEEAAAIEVRKARQQVDDRLRSLKIGKEGTIAPSEAKAESKYNLSIPDDAGKD